MKNKLLLLGCVLIFSGTVLFGLIHLAIALYIPHLSGWSDPPGKFETVLNDISGWGPYILSIVLMIIGGLTVIFDVLPTKMLKNDDLKS